MSLNLSEVLTIGEVIKFPDGECKLEWKIPAFVLEIDEDDMMYVSPAFSFSGANWRFYIRIYFHDINVGLKRDSTIPPINLEVSVAFNFLTGNKDQKISAEYLTINGCDVYKCHKCLLKTDLLEKRSYLLPSNALTVLFTLKHCEKTTKIAGNIGTEKCSHCKEDVNNTEISAHEKKCVNKPIKCPECSKVVPLKCWYDHECQLTVAKGTSCPSGSSQVLQENKVLRDFKAFFLKKENCDVVIKVQEEEIPAHKSILEARSPVFASAFRNDMQEKATGIVDIKDFDPSPFSDFICFLYCGDTGIISKENVFSLFAAADKYDVQDLKEACVKFMKETLSVDTFCDTITLALRFSESELIKLTTDFFIENAKEITVSVKWQSFLVENPAHSNELIVKFIASK